MNIIEHIDIRTTRENPEKFRVTTRTPQGGRVEHQLYPWSREQPLDYIPQPAYYQDADS
jgi:hypothetical protein